MRRPSQPGHISAGSALTKIAGSPLYALDQLISPRLKLHTELELFAPFLFLSLLSPYTLPAIPLIVERFIASRYPNWWTNTFHYNAYLVVPIALGAVDGAVRLDRWLTWAWRSTTRRGTQGRKAGDWLINIVYRSFKSMFISYCYTVSGRMIALLPCHLHNKELPLLHR